jgi:hypothetical protein
MTASILDRAAAEIHPTEGPNPAQPPCGKHIHAAGRKKLSDPPAKLISIGLTPGPPSDKEHTMGMLDCRADVYANGRQYTVRAITLPPAGEHGERIEVSLTGLDADDTATAFGSLTLPPSGLAAVGRLLQQVMTGLSTLNGRSSSTPAANAQAPWSGEQDEELMELWLAAARTTKATTVRRHLADHFGRSMGSIRARLLHIGCNPESPGHAYLPVRDNNQTTEPGPTPPDEIHTPTPTPTNTPTDTPAARVLAKKPS